MTTKKQITEKVKELKKLGLELITFQTDRQKRRQEKNMPDYFLYGRGYLIFLECKIGKDKLSKGQEIMLTELEYIAKKNKSVYVSIITDKNYNDKINEIINWIAN